MTYHWKYLLAIAGLLLAGPLAGQEKTKQVVPSFNGEVLPILRTYCVACHNPEDREGGLDLETFAGLSSGGKGGSVVTGGHAKLSRLVRVLDGRSRPAMPPEGTEGPSVAEIELLQRWIDGGAPGPDGTSPPATLVTPRIQPDGRVREPITSMAFMPRGRGPGLVAVARTHRVTIESLDGRKKYRQFQPAEGVVNSICFSRDGKMMVTGGGETGIFGEAIAWDPQSGRKKFSLRGHRDTVFGVALDPSGKFLATAGYDRTLVIWDLASRAPLHEIRGHNGSIHDLAFHPRGHILATASDDRTVKLWDVATGNRLDTLNQSLKELYCLAFSPDGKQLAAAGVDNRIRVWEISDNGRGGTNPLRYSVFAHQGAILKLAYSQDGEVLVSSAEDSLVKTWNADTMSLRRTLPREGDWVTALVTAADDLLLMGQLDGERVTARTTISVAEGAQLESYFEPLGLVSYGEQPAVDSLEIQDEQEPNDQPEKARVVSLPAVVRGKIFSGVPEGLADVDLYRFQASRGDQWVIETRAAADKSELDSMIEILTSDGRPVPRLLLRAVRDSEVEFRAITSDQRGARLKNYEEMLLNEYVYINGEVIKHFRQRRGPDSESLFYPEDGSRHTFFDTTARSHPLGQLCYVVIPYPTGTVLPDNGLPVFTVNYENDDDGERKLGRDSRINFVAPQDGDYLVRVKDVRGFEGEKFDYRLILRRPSPDFSISVEGMNPQVNAGNGKAFAVRVVRSDDFQGPVRVDIESVPPGFQVTTPLVIEAGHTRARGVIHAMPGAPETNAANWGTSRLTATAMVAGSEVVKSAGTLGTIKLVPRAKVVVHMTPDDGSLLPVSQFIGSMERPWTILAPRQAMVTGAGASLVTLADQSLLAGGENHETETYVVTTSTIARGIRSLRMDALAHTSLPAGSPGRAPDNGNFVISEITVTATPRDGSTGPVEVMIDRVRADYSQVGWDVAGISDGDEKTGWAVAREQGGVYPVMKNGEDPSHWVELDFQEPVDIPGGAVLTVTIKCTSSVKYHNLGHFQLSYTTESWHPPERVAAEPLEVTIVAGKMAECRLSVERFGLNARISFDVENLPHGVIVNDIGLSGVLIPENQYQRTIFLAAEPWVKETRRLFHAVAKVEGNQVSLPMILHVVRPEKTK